MLRVVPGSPWEVGTLHCGSSSWGNWGNARHGRGRGGTFGNWLGTVASGAPQLLHLRVVQRTAPHKYSRLASTIAENNENIEIVKM